MPVEKPVRVLFFGMLGEFSRLVFESLLEFPDAEIAGVITAGHKLASGSRKGDLPVRLAGPFHVADLARGRGLPCLHVDNLKGSETLEWISGLSFDMILVACFSHYIPSTIYQLPKLGSFNLHPSLLPAYRGPMPMFWQFRHAEQEFGVTLHQIIDTMDGGPIALQDTHKLVPGCTGLQMNQELGSIAAGLAREFISALPDKLRLTQQDESLASYQGYPAPSDFSLDINSTARDAYIFMKGTQHWNQVYSIKLGNQVFEIDRAIEFRENERQSSELINMKRGYSIQFRQGLLHVRELRKVMD